MPAAAVADSGGGIVDGIINAGLTVVLLGFAAFIGSYLLEAVKELGTQGAAIAEYDRNNPVRKAPVERDAVVFDDSGSGAVSDEEIRKEVEYREKYGAGTKQVLGGKRVAPWMNIDEKMVEKLKEKKDAERKKRKDSGVKLPWEG